MEQTIISLDIPERISHHNHYLKKERKKTSLSELNISSQNNLLEKVHYFYLKIETVC